MTALFLAVLALALAELDAVRAGQFMISRPIVFGPIFGFLFGQPYAGVLLGVLFEFFSLEDFPVGANVVPSATLSAGAAILLVLEPPAVPLELAFPAGLALGQVHRISERALRRRHEGVAHEAARKLSGGEDSALGGALRQALVEHCAATAALLVVVLWALKPLLAWTWTGLPGSVQAGFEWGFNLSPWLAVATLLRALISPSMREA